MEIQALIRRRLKAGDVILTVSQGKPNRVAAVDDEGLWVETAKSDANDTGPQLVPWWMFEAAWSELGKSKSLTQAVLLHDLNVKRSATVFAALAMLPQVAVTATRPATIELTNGD